MKLQLWKHLVALTGINAEHNAEKVQTNYVIIPIFKLFLWNILSFISGKCFVYDQIWLFSAF